MNLLFLLEIDFNFKQSKTQYQTLQTRKLPFEASDLSRYPIKNLQSTINIISDKEDEIENLADIGDQLQFSSSRLFSEIPFNKDKEK